MLCSKCGKENDLTAAFCTNCGNSLKTQISDIKPIEQVEPAININGDIAIPMPKENVQKKAQKFNFINYVISFLLRPVSTLKEKVAVFEDIKLSAIFTSLIAGFAVLLNLITSIYNTVRVNTAGWLSEPRYEFVWENIKQVKWFDLIIKNFIIYIGIIAIIALVYFLAGLIVKKQLKYSRLTAIVTSAIIPLVASNMMLSPIVSWISSDLGLIVSIIGLVYSLIILIGGLNRELDLADDNLKFYINLSCLSLLSVIAYYVMMNFLMSIITSGASDFFEGMFS